MKKRRLVFWILLIAFFGGVIFWLVHVPYRPERMYRLIPAQADFVSTHIELAPRWDEFSGNPIALSLFRTMGLDIDEWAEELEDPNVRHWVDKLLVHRTVIAHVPSVGRYGVPSWFGVSWIGGESIQLRWLLKRGRLDGMTRVDHHAGVTFWRVEGDPEDREYLSLAVVEGMVVAAWSEDPDAVQYALDTYDGRFPSLVDTQAHGFEPRCGEQALDWGWYHPRDVISDFLPLYFEFSRIDERGLSGALCVPGSEHWERIPLNGLEPLGRLLGPLPFTFVGAHPDGFWALWDQWAPETWNAATAYTLREVPVEGPMVLAVMGNEYGGRLFGIGVPSLMLAAYVGEGEAAVRAAKDTLDGLNGRYRWGLVPQKTHVGNHPVYVVESTADTAYARFRFRDQIAYTHRDGWFLAASHADALMKLMTRYEGIGAVAEADEGPWRTGMAKSDAAAYGWLDLSRGATVVRTAIMAWSLKLLFEDPVESEDIRRRLSEARAWVDALAPMLRMQLWLDADGEMTTLKFELGE